MQRSGVRDQDELQDVLSAFQSTGVVKLMEEAEDEALCIEHLRREVRQGLTDDCARKLHRLSRMLQRLSKRIDRVVTMRQGDVPPLDRETFQTRAKPVT